MAYYDEELQRLQEQVSRQKQLEAKARELRAQRGELQRRADELAAASRREQADVDKLEGRSLAAFFYNVIGKMDERLDKEREEAYAAAVKYDAAAGELAAAERELAECEAELAGLNGCEQRYNDALREKARAVKAAGGSEAAELLRLEERAAFLAAQQRELAEAIAAGEAALQAAERVLSELNSAHNWGTWDMLGGGLLTTAVKHSRLDEAQREVEEMQSQLRRFKTELADVTIDASLQVNVDGFLRVADFVFDNLFVDWAVLSEISRSEEQVRQVQSQIEAVLAELQKIKAAAGKEQTALAEQIETLLREARQA